MKNIIFILLTALTLIGCDKDKTGPSIMLSETSFCVDAGDDIVLTVEITDEDLKEVNLTAPDLDFITSITADEFESAGGVITFNFSTDSMTPSGTYIMGVEALDTTENASTSEVTIKIN